MPNTCKKVIVAVVFFGLILVAAIPLIKQARVKATALQCINNLRCVDGGKQQWALENHQNPDAVPTWLDLVPYIQNCFQELWRSNGVASNYAGPSCPGGGAYRIGCVADAPTCTVPGHDLELGGASVCVEEDRMHPIVGATVVVIDEPGRRREAMTDENGCVKIETWPKRASSVIVSKVGYVTISNTFPLTNTDQGWLRMQKKVK